MLTYLVFVGAAVHLLGSSFYIWRTLKGRTKPNRATFFIWAFTTFIVVPAALSDGAGWAVLPVFMAGLMPLLIFFASFVNPNAYWQLGRLDYTCGAISLFALFLWAVTQNPFYAVLFAIISDIFASWPTIVKSWQYPETEYWSGYAGAMFNSFTTFAVAGAFTFTVIAFPLYLIIANTIILFGIFRGRFRSIEA